MYAGSDYSPSDNPEVEPYSLDFVNDLPSGDTISTAAWTVTVANDSQVIDPSPSARFIGGPFISGTVVTGKFSAFVTGCKYVLQCTVQTAQSNQLILYSHVTAEVIG